MTRALVALFLILQALDFATFMLAPQLESNPTMRALPVAAVLLAKVAGVGLALAVVWLIRTPWLRATGLGIGIAIAGICVGANLATISIVNAAEPSRPAASVVLPGRAPDGWVTSQRTGPARRTPAVSLSGGLSMGAATHATSTTGTGAASSSAAADPTPSAAPKPKPKPARATLRGRASWVRADLGDRYLAARLPKGTRLRICGPAGCWSGTVNDYGPSRRVHPERIVDLSRAAFTAVCGDPSMGVCRVSVR